MSWASWTVDGVPWATLVRPALRKKHPEGGPVRLGQGTDRTTLCLAKGGAATESLRPMLKGGVVGREWGEPFVGRRRLVRLGVCSDERGEAAHSGVDGPIIEATVCAHLAKLEARVGPHHRQGTRVARDQVDEDAPDVGAHGVGGGRQGGGDELQSFCIHSWPRVCKYVLLLLSPPSLQDW